MGSEDKTPKPGPVPPPVAAQVTHPYGAPPPHHTNPWGVPFTPWPVPPPEDKKLIPEWLKFAISGVSAAVLVASILWKGGAIVNRFETLEKKVDQATAQQDVRDKQRDLREQLKDGADQKWREEMNARLSRLSITRNRPRRAADE